MGPACASRSQRGSGRGMCALYVSRGLWARAPSNGISRSVLGGIRTRKIPFRKRALAPIENPEQEMSGKLPTWVSSGGNPDRSARRVGTLGGSRTLSLGFGGQGRDPHARAAVPLRGVEPLFTAFVAQDPDPPAGAYFTEPSAGIEPAASPLPRECSTSRAVTANRASRWPPQPPTQSRRRRGRRWTWRESHPQPSACKTAALLLSYRPSSFS